MAAFPSSTPPWLRRVRVAAGQRHPRRAGHQETRSGRGCRFSGHQDMTYPLNHPCSPNEVMKTVTCGEVRGNCRAVPSFTGPSRPSQPRRKCFPAVFSVFATLGHLHRTECAGTERLCRSKCAVAFQVPGGGLSPLPRPLEGNG